VLATKKRRMKIKNSEKTRTDALELWKIGYFLKKVTKILIFVLGEILALLMYLQFQEIVATDQR
jgi:hypothetical protein